jgi:hypothetical protein
MYPIATVSSGHIEQIPKASNLSQGTGTGLQVLTDPNEDVAAEDAAADGPRKGITATVLEVTKDISSANDIKISQSKREKVQPPLSLPLSKTSPPRKIKMRQLKKCRTKQVDNIKHEAMAACGSALGNKSSVTYITS